MPVKMLNLTRTPPPPRMRRGTKSAIERSQEWQDLTLALGNGLKPAEYIAIELPADFGKQLGLSEKTTPSYFTKKVQDRVKELKLPYDVYAKDLRSNGGLFTVYVVGRGL